MGFWGDFQGLNGETGGERVVKNQDVSSRVIQKLLRKEGAGVGGQSNDYYKVYDIDLCTFFDNEGQVGVKKKAKILSMLLLNWGLKLPKSLLIKKGA